MTQNTASATAETKKATEDMVYDLDSGEMLTREEYNRR